eukprot:143857-Lingulodinium_polyedra.AAC.1
MRCENRHWCSHGVCDASVWRVRNDAGESSVCRHSGLQCVRLAHSMQTPKAGVRMECVRRAICEPLWRQAVVVR